MRRTSMFARSAAQALCDDIAFYEPRCVMSVLSVSVAIV
jgi:hypothetical protein